MVTKMIGNENISTFTRFWFCNRWLMAKACRNLSIWSVSMWFLWHGRPVIQPYTTWFLYVKVFWMVMQTSTLGHNCTNGVCLVSNFRHFFKQYFVRIKCTDFKFWPPSSKQVVGNIICIMKSCIRTNVTQCRYKCNCISTLRQLDKVAMVYDSVTFHLERSN